MSGAGAGDQQGHNDGLFLYGDPTAGFDHSDDVDSFFFHGSLSRAGPGGVSADGYSSITDYLQGFLQDPAAGMSVVQAGVSGRHDDHHLVGGAPPVTPTNDSSVLSSSSEAVGGEEPWRGITPNNNSSEVDDDKGSVTDRNFKGSRVEKKKRGEKKARQPRVAFMTKSQVDHLEDGYRWRKYGQKAVKNSSFPRSYYRCTAARCGVKKLVERSQQDPSSVITTYEGQHTHPSPVGRAGSFLQPLHQLGPDDLARMAAYAHGSPAAAAGMAPPPTHLLRQEYMRYRP